MVQDAADADSRPSQNAVQMPFRTVAGVLAAPAGMAVITPAYGERLQQAPAAAVMLTPRNADIQVTTLMHSMWILLRCRC